jgi:hypothetical protein
MRKFFISAVSLFMCLLLVSVCAAQSIYPYAPWNAVAATPLEPYNLWQIPECSRTSYPPCPSPIPYSAQVPDIPPVWAPFPGPFGMPVPVP